MHYLQNSGAEFWGEFQKSDWPPDSFVQEVGKPVCIMPCWLPQWGFFLKKLEITFGEWNTHSYGSRLRLNTLIIFTKVWKLMPFDIYTFMHSV